MRFWQKMGVCAAGAAVGAGALAAAPAAADPAAHTTAPGGDVTARSRCLVWTENIGGTLGLTAGYSRTWTTEVDPGDTGDLVREIQCLTDYYGDGPSSLDGVYGPATTAAVKLVQKQCPLPPSQRDGIVGPTTWHCLRIP
jgi:peptidoglycan hydrolase-like protein with peptidoglycan-binding domain